MRLVLILPFALVFQTWQLFGQKINAPAQSFTLKTQYDQSFTYKFPDGNKTIITIGDRKSGKQASGWAKKIKESLKDGVRYIQIAATGWVPFFAKNQVLEGFLNKPSILINWNNDVSNLFGYTSKKAMIIYINPQGLIKAFEKGEMDSVKYNRFIPEVYK